MRLGLKNCPFCCNNEIISEQTKKNGWRVGCYKCGVYVDGKVITLSVEWLRDKLEHKWNDRQLYGDEQK